MTDAGMKTISKLIREAGGCFHVQIGLVAQQFVVVNNLAEGELRKYAAINELEIENHTNQHKTHKYRITFVIRKSVALSTAMILVALINFCHKIKL